jgi:hypothetical protein
MKSTDDKSLCIRDDGMKPLEGFQPLFPVITNDYPFMLVAELTKAIVNFEAVGFDLAGRGRISELTTHACKAQPVMKIDGKLFSC